MSDGDATLGVVLAGGRARRLGGGDKASRAVAGISLLDRVVARLRPQCDAIVLNANGDPRRFQACGLTVVPDDVPDHSGPLAGILAALDWAAARRPDLGWVASAPADTPFLPRDLVARLHAARRQAGSRLACAASGGRRHPVVGLWPVAIRAELREALVVRGERRVSSWTDAHTVATADWDVRSRDPFFNVNTPSDLDLAERLAAADDQTSEP